MSETIITLPVNNTVKLASSGNADWKISDIPSTSLQPYLNRTDVIILTGQLNAQAMTYSDGAYHYGYNSQYNSSRNYYYLGGRVFISKLQISSKINTSQAGSRIQVFLYDYSSNTEVFSFNRNGQPVDSDFVEFEKYPNVYADYLGIRFAADAIDLKDISIIITTASPSGGAGSGYIGNTLVSNKKMVGYNAPTSSAESTKTESVEDASESPVSGKPKIGNGYAKIRFLRPLEEKSIVAEMLASNQLKVNGNGEAPTITSGSFGTYDSVTDSYYFSNNCRMDWKNWSALGVDLDKISRLTKIEFEWEGQIRNTSYGQSFDQQMQTYFNTNLLFINGIADGYYDAGSDYQKFARIKNGGADQWETTEQVPFNNSQYQNAFHKVKWVWEIENSVAKKITIYLDDVVFCTHTDIDYEFEITALGNQFLRCDVIDHTNVKSVKIAFYYMG